MAAGQGARLGAVIAAAAAASVAILLAAGGDTSASRAPAPAASRPVPTPPSGPAAAERSPALAPRALPPPAASPAPAPVADEAAATARLRDLVDADPEAALALADEADHRDPKGPQVEERAFLRMRSLVNLGRIGDARTAAEAFFEQHPGSPWGERVYRLTGVHPRPRPPVDLGR